VGRWPLRTTNPLNPSSSTFEYRTLTLPILSDRRIGQSCPYKRVCYSPFRMGLVVSASLSTSPWRPERIIVSCETPLSLVRAWIRFRVFTPRDCLPRRDPPLFRFAVEVTLYRHHAAYAAMPNMKVVPFLLAARFARAGKNRIVTVT